MKMLSLWLHIIICLVHYQTGFAYNTSKNHLCHEEESQLLLQLRQLVPPQEDFESHQWCPGNYPRLMYWHEKQDCCVWDGVTCDKSTGHVIGLDLSCSVLTGSLDSNSSLFRLNHLQKLNLAYNYFDSKISYKFGHLNSLTHLNLSYSAIGGVIPLEFYHLSNLVSLDMRMDPFDPIIYCDIKALLGNMTKLRVVVLQEVSISSELPLNMSSFLTRLDLPNTLVHGNLPVTIFEKPNLQFLNLGGNDGLSGSLPSFNRSSVSLIEQLLLQGTNISGRLPDSIGFMTKLNQIILSECKFSGQIPASIGNLTEISQLDFSSNEFSGEVPSTLAYLRQLTQLDLSQNHLQGQLPDAFSDLQKLTTLQLNSNGFIGAIPSSLTNMSQLNELFISSNALTGQIPSSLTNMPQLQLMDISSNKLTGTFPSRAGDGLQKLTTMWLADNSIQGMVPSWLLSLPSLFTLDLSSNNLTGEIDKFNSESLNNLHLSNNLLYFELDTFYNLSQTEQLFLSHNTVIEHGYEVEVVNVSLPHLGTLDLSSCGIKEFPNFLRNLSRLTWLGLSDNEIHGPIPNWFSFLPLTYLNLATNYLTHAPWQQLWNINFLDLHSNSLQGIFPSSICNMTELSILNLSSNKLRGTIPECIGNLSLNLEVLDLRRNELHGKIPTTIGVGFTFSSLVNLGLNANHLEGPLPRSLANCTSLEVVDVGNNLIRDTFPSWLQNLTGLKVLILKSNSFHGSITPPVSNNSFSKLQIIDLSYNNFSGILPELFFTRLHAMIKQDEVSTNDLYMRNYRGYDYSVTLSVKGANVELTRVLRIFTTIDVSSNNFEGSIPQAFKDLILLRLLNLSHNRFSGSIPQALGSMTKLEQLDLSSNQLRGRIPQTLTNLTFLAVLNLSYNRLVGPIPKGNQFPTFLNETYVGNSGLCGAPLTASCGGEPPSSGVFDEEEEEEEEDFGFMTGFTWKTVVIGYGCGIVFGFILGNVMVSAQKPKWLARFVYTEAAIILKRHKKKAARMVLLGTR